jgi:hypothetical protein
MAKKPKEICTLELTAMDQDELDAIVEAINRARKSGLRIRVTKIAPPKLKDLKRTYKKLYGTKFPEGIERMFG